MPKSKIPSPARSHSGNATPRRQKSRRSRSMCSPALSIASGRLTSLIDQFKDKNMGSFALSPLNGRSVLSDNTEIEEPRRKSWWKKLDENSQDVMEVLENNKVTDANNVEELIDIEILSQEKKDYTLDLPESSDNESINSIVLPQRRLFTQKENQPQKKFGQIIGNRETLAKLHKTNTTTNIDKTLNTGTRELFQKTKRSKPVFPAALLNISPNKTTADKTKENVAVEPKPQVRNIFGNRPTNKRKNIFADFIASESEDEIPEIQPKVFGFQKKLDQRRISVASKGRGASPTSSITTDMELDEWKHLPSSTMVENQLEDMVAEHTPIKRARLSKLSEAKESEGGTVTLQTNTTVDKTKQSNKFISSKNKSIVSPEVKDKTLDNSRTTRSMSKNLSRPDINNSKSKRENTKINKSHGKIPSKDNELDVPASNPEFTDTQNTTLSNKSQTYNKSKTKNCSKQTENTKGSIENNEPIDNETRKTDKSINKNLTNNTITNKSLSRINMATDNPESANTCTNTQDKVSKTSPTEEKDLEDDENNFTLEYDNDDSEIESDQEESKQNATEADEEIENDVNELKENDDEANEEADGNEETNEVKESQDIEANISNQEKSEQNATEIDEEIENDVNESEENEDVAHEEADGNEETNEVNGSQDIEANISKQEKSEQNATEIDREIENDVNESEENDDEANEEADSNEETNEINESQDIEANISNEVENVAGETDDDDVPDEENEAESSIDQNDENESQGKEDTANESQEVENVSQENEVEEESGDVHSETNESEEDADDPMDESENNDNAVASDAEISEQGDNDDDVMEVDDENEQSNEDVDEREQPEENESNQLETGKSSEEIEESPNVTHDTTGRNRNTKCSNKSPEAILRNKNNQMDSFYTKGQNTSTRKTKSMIKDLNIKPSLAPHRDSTCFSDGTKNSSAEGSGWDSHRTTRKTLRQTFGKDFTPRKSLRALVMEKSAKRQTEHLDMHSVTVKYPQANSTELPDDTNVDHGVDVESDHEMSRRTRQTTLEMYLEKIKQQNIEYRLKVEEAVKNSLKGPIEDTLSLFKVPSKPAPRRPKPTQSKPKKQLKSIIPLVELPPEVIEDMKYKPPKRYRPTSASWITKRLYKFLENKLEPRYDYKARVRAEKLVETIYNFAKDLRRHKVAPVDAVEVLKHEMARLDVVSTHFEFYEFFHEFMPREIRIKVVPDIVNKIALPRHGVFSEILQGNTVQD